MKKLRLERHTTERRSQVCVGGRHVPCVQTHAQDIQTSENTSIVFQSAHKLLVWIATASLLLTSLLDKSVLKAQHHREMSKRSKQVLRRQKDSRMAENLGTPSTVCSWVLEIKTMPYCCTPRGSLSSKSPSECCLRSETLQWQYKLTPLDTFFV